MTAAPRWTFGEEPLPQTVRAAARLRRVTNLVLSLEHSDPQLEGLIDALETAEQALATRVPPDPSPRVGDAAAVDGRLYLDHARDVGTYNPCFPEYDIAVDGDRAAGTVTFPIAYEGPPGIVHGGFLGVFFDLVIQHHNCDLGVTGKTTDLVIRFRRPTPLRTELRFELDRAVDGSRITSEGRLLAGHGVLCEARMHAVKGERSQLPEVSPRRPPP